MVVEGLQFETLFLGCVCSANSSGEAHVVYQYFCMYRLKEGRYFNLSTHSMCHFSCQIHAVSLYFQ